MNVDLARLLQSFTVPNYALLSQAGDLALEGLGCLDLLHQLGMRLLQGGIRLRLLIKVQLLQAFQLKQRVYR